MFKLPMMKKHFNLKKPLAPKILYLVLKIKVQVGGKKIIPTYYEKKKIWEYSSNIDAYDYRVDSIKWGEGNILSPTRYHFVQKTFHQLNS